MTDIRKPRPKRPPRASDSKPHGNAPAFRAEFGPTGRLLLRTVIPLQPRPADA
jgi:hypothetical protein